MARDDEGDDGELDEGDRILDDDPYINDILHDLGRDWADVLVNIDYDNNPDHYRPGEYSTPEEALIDYYERGLGDYIEIYYDADCDCYEVYVTYTGD